jgi:eukaryotic-like serine/threonine-protein kinase
VATNFDPRRLPTGLVGGRYEITGLIASGGMGEVFAARDTVLDRRVALKVLHARVGADASFVERFRREAMAAARLGHPNIVQVYDYGRDQDGSAYMAMEFVDGQNLRQILSAKGRIRPAVAARIAEQVCAALETARRAGIVHRDIKPENILLTPEGQVKVADFGLARALAESRATQAGVVLGTAAYLAPEQVEGRPTDHRADIYALGCMLFEMLTGRPPFTGDNPVVVAYRRVAQDVPKPSAVAPDVSRQLDDVVAKASARKPEDRYGSAAQMAMALRSSVAAEHDTGDLADLSHHTIAIPIAHADTIQIVRRPPSKRRWFIVALSIVTAAVVFVPAGLRLTARATVPTVAGLTQEIARDRLRKAGFTVSTVPQNHTTIKSGRVIKTDPPANARVRKGSEVALYFSIGPELVAVPDVRGKTLTEAKKLLAARELKVVSHGVYDGRVPKFGIIDQQPQPPASVAKGSEVNLTVSNGPEQVVVPDVRGKTEQEARDLLSQYSFGISVRRAPSDTVPLGQVINSTPGPGARADKGSVVAVVISQGPAEFPMPDVRGDSFAKAKAELEARGLKVTRSQVPGSSGDTVVSHTPKPGQKVRRGDSVILYTA